MDDKNFFLWFGITTIVLSLVLLSSQSFRIINMGFVVFLGIMLMPISLASLAAGILEGSRIKISTIFLIYFLFFGIVFLVPSLI